MSPVPVVCPITAAVLSSLQIFLIWCCPVPPYSCTIPQILAGRIAVLDRLYVVVKVEQALHLSNFIKLVCIAVPLTSPTWALHCTYPTCPVQYHLLHCQPVPLVIFVITPNQAKQQQSNPKATKSNLVVGLTWKLVCTTTHPTTGTLISALEQYNTGQS